jgi:SHS2 domain-containing protein
MERFEFIDHTADVGVRVWGNSIEELFANAAYAMFSVIANLEAVQETLHQSVEVESGNYEELLVEWLRELLYISSVKEKLFKRFEIKQLEETRLAAICHGEPIELDRHELLTEVKTVTYHGLYIAETPSGWEAQLVFDT